MTRVVVLGASPNMHRYSNQAVHRLLRYGFDVIPIGIRKGRIENLEIITQAGSLSGIDTVTLYLSEENQKAYYDKIFDWNPRRLIFNPGAENYELAEMAASRGIEVLNECTLVMLATDEF